MRHVWTDFTERMWMIMSVEIWKPIAGYEGLYEVSNMGRIKSNINNKILKPYEMKNGYLQYSLYSNNIKHRVYIHRLVAEAFIPNPEGKRTVNHIDENKLNNCVENLEWATQLENLIYGTGIERRKKTRQKNHKMEKQVDVFTIDNEYLGTFRSIKIASIIMNANESAISACCIGRKHYETVNGYVFRYKNGGDSNGNT